MKHKLIQTIINSLFLLLYPWGDRALGETVLEEINRTGLIKIGIREDAIPFGYRDRNNQWEGTCLDLSNAIVEKIKQTLKNDIVTVELYESTLYNRFDLVDERTIHLECGPNTITNREDKKIEFSAPFFLTGTQLLIKKDDPNAIAPSISLENATIGVLRNTTTEKLIGDRYPLAQIQEFQGVTGRRRGVQAVQQEKIDAFASDGILLIGEATLEGLSLDRDYFLYPQSPLDCSYYGLILPSDDPQWKNLVDSVIQSPQTEIILERWFGRIAPYLGNTLDRCSIDL